MLAILLLKGRAVHLSKSGAASLLLNLPDVANESSPFVHPATSDRHVNFGLEAGQYLNSVERFLELASQVRTMR